MIFEVVLIVKILPTERALLYFNVFIIKVV